MSNEITRFSDFIRNASVTEKEKVFKRVMERATKRQEEKMATRCSTQEILVAQAFCRPYTKPLKLIFTPHDGGECPISLGDLVITQHHQNRSL